MIVKPNMRSFSGWSWPQLVLAAGALGALAVSLNMAIAAADTSPPTAGEGSAFDEILAGQGRDLRFEIVGFGSPNSWLPRVRALDIVISGTITPERYELEAQIETVGVASWFAQHSYTMSIEGVVRPDGLHTTSYRSQSRKGRVNTSIWTADDVEVTVSYPPGKEPDEDHKEEHELFTTTPEQKRQGADFMTALLNHIIGATTTAANPCAGRLQIFDTVRRYDILLSLDAETFFNDGVWKGPVQQCRVDIEQVSVRKEADEKEDEKEGEENMVWKFAELGAGKPNFLVAVDAKRKNGGRLSLVVNKIRYTRSYRTIDDQ